MSSKLRIALAQLNLTVGSIDNNLTKHIENYNIAKDKSADLIVFPELSLTGYPPEDLLLQQSFLDASEKALQELTQKVTTTYCIVGHPLKTKDGLFNACSILHNGKIIATYKKQMLPNFGVFDEKRYFKKGDAPCIFEINNTKIGIIICQDLWHQGPMKNTVAKGADIIVSLNASPFEINKHEQRVEVLKTRINDTKTPVVYVNTIGGQDDLVFDGGSMVMDNNGKIIQLCDFFKESLTFTDFTNHKPNTDNKSLDVTEPDGRIYQALCLGLKDYLKKNNIKGVIVGLSGGIDSALTLTIAKDALGAENVHAVLMPSQFTSDISNDDATQLAKNLNVKYDTIPIQPAFETFKNSLNETLKGEKVDVTEQNIQSRCRCIILMAISNHTGNIVLTTGNRSELAVGYATLYGDMAGGFSVLKDVSKTLVYKLAKYRNTIDSAIPERIITRAPTAELAPDQKDEDSLPPYPILDKILYHYLNEKLSAKEIIAKGFDSATVEKVIKLVKNSEFKRRQAPIGVRIDQIAFGRDRRYPITSGF